MPKQLTNYRKEKQSNPRNPTSGSTGVRKCRDVSCFTQSPITYRRYDCLHSWCRTFQ